MLGRTTSYIHFIAYSNISVNCRKTKQDGGEENEELWSSVDKENLFQNVWTRISLPIPGTLFEIT